MTPTDTTTAPEDDGWNEPPPRAAATAPTPAAPAPKPLPSNAASITKVRAFLQATEMDLNKIATLLTGHIVGRLRAQIVEGLGETLPKEMTDRLAMIELALKHDIGTFEAQMIDVYRRHFSEAELNDLVAFYATPGGKKMVAVGGLLPQELDAVSDSWQQAVFKTCQPELRKLLLPVEADAPTNGSPAA
jgi:hypothetical protein